MQRGNEIRVAREIRVTSAIGARIQAADGTFRSLQRSLFRGRTVSWETKLRVYDAMIAPQLMFGAECWTTTRADDSRINRAQQRWLRHLTGMNPKWDSSRGHIVYPPCHEVFRKACRPMASDAVTFAQTRFYGHILRRGDDDDARFLVAPDRCSCTRTTDELVEAKPRVGRVARKKTAMITTTNDDGEEQRTTMTTTATVSVRGLRSIPGGMRRRSIDVRMTMQATAAGLKPEYAESRTDWRNLNVAWRKTRCTAAGLAPAAGERAPTRGTAR